MDASLLGLIVRRAQSRTPAEGSSGSAQWRVGGWPGTHRVRGEVHGKESKLSGYVRVERCSLTADAEVTIRVGTTDAHSSLFQKGAVTERGATTMVRAPSARALATKALRRGAGGKAKRVSRCTRPQAGHGELPQSGTVKASSASARGSA